jgi:multiple sugar transport system substrate-binding protein
LFAEGTWDQVTLGTDSVFAIPQDIGPMMMLYRHDIFDEMGLEVPTTWDEFRDVAAEVRDQDPDRYLTNFSPGDAGWFTGLSQQAGAEWWQTAEDSWVVAIDDEPTQRVAEYWEGLVDDDLVSSESSFTPGWNADLNDGALLVWLGAVWSPEVIAGAAEGTQGNWAMAPLPNWDAGEQVTGFWGGSSTAIAADSPSQDDAFRFAVWLNTDPEAVAALVEIGGIYPASVDGQQALDDPPPFMPNQPDFFEEAAEIAETAQGFTFGPNVNTTYNLYNDSFDQAIREGTSFLDAVTRMHEGTVSDLEGRGFDVQG